MLTFTMLELRRTARLPFGRFVVQIFFARGFYAHLGCAALQRRTQAWAFRNQAPWVSEAPSTQRKQVPWVICSSHLEQLPRRPTGSFLENPTCFTESDPEATDPE